jgi:hypothetical protein
MSPGLWPSTTASPRHGARRERAPGQSPCLGRPRRHSGRRWTRGLGVVREVKRAPSKLGLPAGQGEESGGSPTAHVDGGAGEDGGAVELGRR